MKKGKILSIVIVPTVAIWLINTSMFVANHGGQPTFLAHRGLGQTFDIEKVKWDSNTAEIIHEPTHPYLENTLEGIAASIQNGADVIEFDVRLTKDKQLAVFHDDLLEYRTNGKGPVSDFTMDDLRKLDIGHGYTADGGKTFPFRGKGIGKMPSIDQLFKAFPEAEWLIHMKDQGVEPAKILEAHLLNLKDNWQQRVAIYGDETAVGYFRNKYPKIRTLTKSVLKNALIQYELIGWTGYTPKAIRNLELHIPASYARLLWGWPDKFLQRMGAVNTRVVLVQYVNGWSAGFDSRKDLEALPQNYSGCIWTNRVDVVAPIIRKQ